MSSHCVTCSCFIVIWKQIVRRFFFPFFHSFVCLFEEFDDFFCTIFFASAFYSFLNSSCRSTNNLLQTAFLLIMHIYIYCVAMESCSFFFFSPLHRIDKSDWSTALKHKQSIDTIRMVAFNIPFVGEMKDCHKQKYEHV